LGQNGHRANLLHITDESGTAEQLSWSANTGEVAERGTRATSLRASSVIRAGAGKPTIFSSQLVHGRSRLAGPGRRQGAAGPTHLTRVMIGLLAGEAKMPHPSARSHDDLEAKA